MWLAHDPVVREQLQQIKAIRREVQRQPQMRPSAEVFLRIQAAIVEEVNAQVEEVTASAMSLSEMSQTLQALVTQFTLPDTSTLPRDRSMPGLEKPAFDQVYATIPAGVRAVEFASGDGRS